jgi:hypothetical protein
VPIGGQTKRVFFRGKKNIDPAVTPVTRSDSTTGSPDRRWRRHRKQRQRRPGSSSPFQFLPFSILTPHVHTCPAFPRFQLSNNRQAKGSRGSKARGWKVVGTCRQFFAGIDCVLGEATLADAGRLIKLYCGVAPPLGRIFFLSCGGIVRT